MISFCHTGRNYLFTLQILSLFQSSFILEQLLIFHELTIGNITVLYMPVFPFLSRDDQYQKSLTNIYVTEIGQD